MADLYRAVAGTLIKSGIDSGGGFISVSGMDSVLAGGRMLVTSIRVNRQQEIQFLKTLSSAFYIYAFGESPGSVNVGGLIFFRDCNGSGFSGISALNAYYETNNAYAKGGMVGVAVGGASFPCLLSAFSISGDMTPYNYVSFSMGFTMVPRSSGGDGGGDSDHNSLTSGTLSTGSLGSVSL